MPRICLDLNVWCAAFIARRMGRRDTAALGLVDAVRSGQSPRGPVSLIMSWGMLERLKTVLARDLGFSDRDAARAVDLIASYAREGPSLTLGGLGVLPLHDLEDRHVLETAWAGQADLLVTANLPDFIQPGDQEISEMRRYQLRRGARQMILAHPYDAVRWMSGET
jgi:hypothetical protein